MMPGSLESDNHRGYGHDYDDSHHVGITVPTTLPTDAPPDLKDTLTQTELEAKIKIIKTECDKICENEKDKNGQPSNFLFFTQYGGEITAEKLAKDKKTDIDLRLICFTIPSTEEQTKVLAQLESLNVGFTIELYFHSYTAYSEGRVGETGVVTGLDVIQNNLDINTVTKLEHPSLVSLYTFATMRTFTNHSNEELATCIQTVVNNRRKLQTSDSDFPDEDKISDTQLNNCKLENLKPENIIEKIKIDKEGIIEWIHMYLKYFLNDYKKFKIEAQQDDSDKKTDRLTVYLMRLAKYLIRIAFGVAIIDGDIDAEKDANTNENYDEIKNNYTNLLKNGIHPDRTHFTLLTNVENDLMDRNNLEIMISALNLRTAENKTEVEKLIENLDINKQINNFENMILSIVQKVGGVLRRKKFDDVQDFLTELAILNLLKLTPQTVETDTTIIEEGTQGDFLFIIPRKKRDGTPNDKYTITSNEELIINPRKEIILGSIGILTDSITKATASITVKSGTEIIKIDRDSLKIILEKRNPYDRDETFLRYYLSGHYNSELDSDENKKDGLLIQSFLNYFSQEFVQYLHERTNSRYSFDNSSSDEKIKPHMLSSYKIDNFGKVLTEVAKKENIPAIKIDDPIDEETIFENNANNEYLYIITDAENNGGVRLNFNNGQTTTLKKNEFFGESSLSMGKNHANYRATLLPGTKIIKIKATDFQELTMTTKLHEVIIDEDKNNYITIETTGSELYYHFGAVLLDRLQNLKD